MPGDVKMSKEYIKLLFLNNLFKNHRSVLQNVNGSQFIRLASGSFVKLDSNGFSKVREQAKKVSAASITKDKEYYALPDGTHFIQARPILNLLSEDPKINPLVAAGATLSDIAWLKNLSAWDLIEIQSLLSVAESDVLRKFQSSAEENGIDITSEGYMNDLQALRLELKKIALESYVRPKVRAINVGTSKEFSFDFAANVFSSCELQLSAGAVPEADQHLVYNLVDKTADSLAGNHEGYLEAVDALPRERTWSNIIIGAALIFAALALLAGAIALSVVSVGACLPVSVLTAEIAVELMLIAASPLLMAAVPSFILAREGIFKINKLEETEATKAIKQPAKEFGALQGVRVRG